VRLVRRADGVANWEGIGAKDPAPADANAKPMSLRVDGIELADGRVSFVDETVPRRVTVESLQLTTDEIAEGEPLTDTKISGVLHMDDFQPAGVPFRVDLPRAELAWDLSSFAVKEFELAFGGLEVEGGAQGAVTRTATRLAGTVATNEFDPRALLAAIGVEAPKTTDPVAFGKVKLAASGQFEDGVIIVEPFALTLDDTHLTGNFRRGAGEDAVGEFALRGDSLAIGRYVPPPDPASEPFVLPTALLKSLAFRGTIELEQATYDDIVMKGVTLRLLLDEQGLRSEKPVAAKP
jgi:hypothetical protein